MRNEYNIFSAVNFGMSNRKGYILRELVHSIYLIQTTHGA